MKQKIIYMLLIACCVGTITSAKQVYKGDSVKCTATKDEKKKKCTKARKDRVATIRPFNFYLVSI
ncbi:MAG TPA: hypothetical protein PK951_04455 [Chitinophagaceae bacterium]|nr:hypothetical protein [Chitinophagaceae bacterium]